MPPDTFGDLQSVLHGDSRDLAALFQAPDGPLASFSRPASSYTDALAAATLAAEMLGFGPAQAIPWPPQEQAVEPAKLTKQVLEAIVFMAERIEDRGRDRCEHPDWFRACVEAGAWAQQQLRLKATAKQRRQERRAKKAAEALRPRGRQIVFAPEGER